MGGPRPQQGQNNVNGNGYMLYFMAFIVIVYVIPVFFSKQQPLFSSSATTVYKFPHKTQNFQAPYYVRQQFYTQSKNPQILKKIEASVDYDFVLKLKKECENLQWTRSQISRQKYKKSCNRLQYLKATFPVYIRTLFNAY